MGLSNSKAQCRRKKKNEHVASPKRAVHAAIKMRRGFSAYTAITSSTLIHIR